MYSPNEQSKKSIQQTNKIRELLTDVRNFFGLSGELLGSHLSSFSDHHDQYQMYSLCCNFFQMEYRIMLLLNEMRVDIFNNHYNTDMLINIDYIPYNFIYNVEQFLKNVQAGKQPLIVRSPNRGRFQ